MSEKAKEKARDIIKRAKATCTRVTIQRDSYKAKSALLRRELVALHQMCLASGASIQLESVERVILETAEW